MYPLTATRDDPTPLRSAGRSANEPARPTEATSFMVMKAYLAYGQMPTVAFALRAE